jgi:predicted double-glycine peptidase
MVAALSAGTPIICSMGPGDFTDNGHFIVLTGYTGDGFTVNDPNSPQRSSQIWTFQQLKGQIRNLWAYGV